MRKTAEIISLFALVSMTSPAMAEREKNIEPARWPRAVQNEGSPVTLAADNALDRRLKMTLLGKLNAGAERQLAVRWDGPEESLIDIWIDFDGDGTEGPGELVISNRPLDPGIGVIELKLPNKFSGDPEPTLRVRTRRQIPTKSVHESQKEVSAPDQIGCGWQPGFFLDDLDGSVLALAVYDDGTGEALYVGGSFTSASGVVVNRIAKWDGYKWAALGGPSAIGMDDSVHALAVFDDGVEESLYAGGLFSSAGGLLVNNIAKWNGSEWSGLDGPSSSGLDGFVLALATYDDGTGNALYVGGSFSTAGGLEVSNLGKWNDAGWSALSETSPIRLNGAVRALEVFDEGSGMALFVGGDFSTAGDLTARRVAKWDGTEWSALVGPLGTGMSGLFDSVEALAVYDGGFGRALYVGGWFASVDGIPVNNIARWDGSSWSALSGPLDSGTDGSVRTLLVFDDGNGEALFAGGSFSSAGGTTVNYIARWNGTMWSLLKGPLGDGTNNPVYSLAIFDDGQGEVLYAGGRFSEAGGAMVNNIAKWPNSEWSSLGQPSGSGLGGPYPYLFDLGTFDDGSGESLFAGGKFTSAGGDTVNYIGKWDGTDWTALRGPSAVGTDQPVTTLAVYDDGTGPALYAGGHFITAGGVTVNHVSRWDGTAWSALSGPSGTGVNSEVSAMASFNDGTGEALYVAGNFTTAGGIPATYIAKWDGNEWSALGQSLDVGFQNFVGSLSVFDDGIGDALFVGGRFSTAEGVVLNNIAKWKGASWSPIGGPGATGTDDAVSDIQVYNDGSGKALHIGGHFVNAGGIITNRIAKWDGTFWSALSGPFNIGMNSSVYTLTTYDDGNGEALYAGGLFTTAGGVNVNHVAKWNGAEWSPLSGPLNTGVDQGLVFNAVMALAVYDDGLGKALFAGGDFVRAGGLVSKHIAKWVCDSESPTDPTTLFSTTHSISAWSATNIVGIEWSGASDHGGSNIAGYSFLFDSFPTTPDTVVEVAHTVDPHSSIGGALADGSDHWFHLRTCDGAGNCSAGVHLGPFWIDSTPPEGVTGLTSTSHAVDTPSTDGTIDVEWTTSGDTLSGVAGYGVTFSTAETWICDRVQDTTGTKATSVALPDGSWYAHVCASDVAGNWGAAASAGPFIIDTAPPTVLSVAGEGGTSDRLLAPNEGAMGAITQVAVNFSEKISNPSGDDTAGDLTNQIHYRVLGLGTDGSINTTADCTSALSVDDVEILLSKNPVAWPGNETASLLLGNDRGLPAGRYAVTVCGLQDRAGNSMVVNWTRKFTVRANNRLLDPNFDRRTLRAWDTLSPDASDIQPVLEDPSSPTSGVVVIEPLGSGIGQTFELTQCFQVSEGTPYCLAGRSRIDSGCGDAPTLKATVRFYRDAGCIDLLETTDAVVAEGDSAGSWTPRFFLSSRAPTEALSARVGCVVEGGAANRFRLLLDETAYFEDVIFVDRLESGDSTWWSANQP